MEIEELEVGGIYRNRVYPDRVVEIEEIEDHRVVFIFLEGLSEDYPRKGQTHSMVDSLFVRYYSPRDQES